ncbi:hypothetical protein K562_10673 [Burkholderia cenocepacia]|nr:hypothetical protein K562_10673 [Burkholderia cenocepacia]SOT42799.1 hypothetical protein F01_420845 [Burkholderia cenocepacia]
MRVGRHKPKGFMSRLRDQQSIERIAMVMRQIAHRGSMYGANR